MTRKKSPTALFFGALPVGCINGALSLELEPGMVKFSANAQKHAARRHPEDFPRCLPFIGAVVGSPLYVGDDGKNAGKIELVGRVVSLGTCLLIAVMIEKDVEGHYNIVSCYPISDQKAEVRRAKGRLRSLK